MIKLYRLNEDREGWEHIGTVTDDGEFEAKTEFAKEELAEEINRYNLPEEEDELLRTYNSPYLRAERVEQPEG